jgi:GNAT superfamily N-acetyltransferase
MSSYRIRPASLDDIDVLVHHRVAMFRDMGTAMDADDLARHFRSWLAEMLPQGTYRGWVVEAPRDGAGSGVPEVVAGAGITVLPWPPGPQFPGGTLAFVYNMYTEPPHRRRGLARMVMEAIHAWCRETGIPAAALNSSVEGQPLYESLGYRVRPNPMMVAILSR